MRVLKPLAIYLQPSISSTLSARNFRIKFWHQKFQTQNTVFVRNFGTKNVPFYKKGWHKALMKLTPEYIKVPKTLLSFEVLYLDPNLQFLPEKKVCFHIWISMFRVKITSLTKWYYLNVISHFRSDTLDTVVLGPRGLGIQNFVRN